jgi:sulfur-carrier protein
MPTITVRYFAMLREERGRSDELLEIAEPVSAAEIYQACCPEAARGGLSIAYAVNGAYAPADTLLKGGDELVFIPPVGGG